MKDYQLTEEETAKAKKLKTQKAVLAFWEELSVKYKFNPNTVTFKETTEKGAPQVWITAESTEAQVLEPSTAAVAAPEHDYNAFPKEYALVITGDAKGDVKAKIAEYKKNYEGLIIDGIEDKNGYLAVHTALRDVRNKRLSIESTRKRLKNEPLELGRAIDAMAREFTESLTPLEEELNAKLKKIDDAKEEIKKQKALELEKVYNARVLVLINKGMQFTGAGYQLAELSISTSEVKGLPDKDWDAFTARLEQVAAAEKERLAKEAEEAKLAQEAQEKEKRTANRIETLNLLGFEMHQPDIYTRSYQSKLYAEEGTATLEIRDIQNMEESLFSEVVELVKGDAKALREELIEAKAALAKQQEEQAAKERELQEQQRAQVELTKKSRVDALAKLGYLYNGEAYVYQLAFNLKATVRPDAPTVPEEQWKEIYDNAQVAAGVIEEEQKKKQAARDEEIRKETEERIRLKAEQEKTDRLAAIEAEKAEQERLEALKPDKEKLLRFAESVLVLPVPELADEKSKELLTDFVQFLGEKVDAFKSRIEAL